MILNIPNNKYQITNKLKFSKLQTIQNFGYWIFGHYLEFGDCNLLIYFCASVFCGFTHFLGLIKI